MAYDWPGNVRELRNVAERFVLGLWKGFDNSDGEVAGSLSDQLSEYESASSSERWLSRPNEAHVRGARAIAQRAV